MSSGNSRVTYQAAHMDVGSRGMVSTAADYARLYQMFLNGGILDGVGLVSRKPIELMTSNHLHIGIPHWPLVLHTVFRHIPYPEEGRGFGLGFGVRIESGRSPLPRSIGDYCYISSVFGPSKMVRYGFNILNREA